MPRPGDWFCPDAACGAHNFASRTACFQCSGPKTTAVAVVPAAVMPTEAVAGSHYYIDPENIPACTWNTLNLRAIRDVLFRGKAGDWMCSSCFFHNFASRDACSQCSTRKTDADVAAYEEINTLFAWVRDVPRSHSRGMKPTPSVVKPAGVKPVASIVPSTYPSATPIVAVVSTPSPAPSPSTTASSDWICPDCAALNFASRLACFKCSIPKPDVVATPAAPFSKVIIGPHYRVDPDLSQCTYRNLDSDAIVNVVTYGKDGDWLCAKCNNNHNYANRTECKQCGEGKTVVGEEMFQEVCQLFGAAKKPRRRRY